jgi:hypothetical protein
MSLTVEVFIESEFDNFKTRLIIFTMKRPIAQLGGWN